MHAKRTATIVLGGGALAAWFAGAATSNRALPDPVLTRPPQIDSRGAALASEIEKLHERLRPSATPRTPGRNLFTFRAAAARAVVDAPAAPRPVHAALKLSGLAVDPRSDEHASA